jgi:hypothetical protein
MKRCLSVAVWVGPAQSAPGAVAIYRQLPGRPALEYMRFSRASVARPFVQAIVKHERACFRSTKTLSSIKKRARR